MVVWECPCGKRNAASFRFCPSCGGPATAGQQITIDNPEPQQPVTLNIPSSWLSFFKAATAASARWATPVLFHLAPAFHRGVGWFKAHPRRARVLITGVVLVGSGWYWFEALPNHFTALRAAHDGIRAAIPTDQGVSFEGGEQVHRIANFANQPFLVTGRVIAGEVGTPPRITDYRCSVYWKGFPGQYAVFHEFGVWQPVSSQEISDNTAGRPPSNEPSAPADLRSAAGAENSVSGNGGEDAPATWDRDGESEAGRADEPGVVATSEPDEDAEHFLRRIYPGSRYADDPGFSGSGIYSYIVTTPDGARRRASLVRVRGDHEVLKLYEEKLR